jgi:predicted deacylase
MAKEIIIGTASSTKAGRATGTLDVGSAPDGAKIAVPVVIVQGEKDGPVLWLHGSVHGNEYCGTYIIHEFLRGLKPSELTGAVVAIPVVNVPAFQSNRRTSPFEIFNGGDMNRQFPGDSGGVATQQMAGVIFAEMKRHAGAFVDFHTAITPDVRWALFPKADGNVGATSEKMARAFGYRDTLPAPMTILPGSAMMSAANEGIPGLIVECGGKGPAFTAEAVKDASERLRNVACALGMLPGRPTAAQPMTFFSNFLWVTASRGGLFEKAVSCGDSIAEGDVVGRYLDVWGDPAGEMRAPRGGVVLAINGGPIIGQGETLVHIGLDPRPA